MNGFCLLKSVRIGCPRKERAEGKVLDDGKLGKDLSVEHFDHTLIFLC